MKTFAKRAANLIVAGGLVACVACGGDDDDPMGDPPDADPGSTYTCDPMGSNPAMGELLNAPVDSDVTVVMKTPQHPGDPGPEGLP